MFKSTAFYVEHQINNETPLRFKCGSWCISNVNMSVMFIHISFALYFFITWSCAQVASYAILFIVTEKLFSNKRAGYTLFLDVYIVSSLAYCTDRNHSSRHRCCLWAQVIIPRKPYSLTARKFVHICDIHVHICFNMAMWRIFLIENPYFYSCLLLILCQQ